jgi:peptidylprolyl isomerase
MLPCKLPIPLGLALSALVSATTALAAKTDHAPTVSDVLSHTQPADWRALEPAQTLVMDLDTGRVVIELAPRFAPRHVANLRTMAHEGYFNGLAILRAQDNYVVQWGDPQADTPAQARSLGSAQTRLPAEFSIPLKGVPLQRLPDTDGWAPEVGLVDGMPVAADPRTGRAWLAHCYGMVGAGRDNPPDSSNGAELYAVIGQNPRGLDLNITLVGRVVQGMEFLSTQPRGHGELGFYTPTEAKAPIRSVRLMADMPPAERPRLEVMRTDTPAWRSLVQARRIRREAWFVYSAGRLDLCNATVPVRTPSGPGADTPAAPASDASK